MTLHGQIIDNWQQEIKHVLLQATISSSFDIQPEGGIGVALHWVKLEENIFPWKTKNKYGKKIWPEHTDFGKDRKIGDGIQNSNELYGKEVFQNVKPVVERSSKIVFCKGGRYEQNWRIIFSNYLNFLYVESAAAKAS